MTNLPCRDGIRFPVKVAANTKIETDELVVLEKNGFAVPAHNYKAKGKVLGRAEHDVDSTSNNGDVSVVITRKHQFLMTNADTDPVTQADLGKDCYVAAVNTVTNNNTVATVVAGKVMQITEDGNVWVEVV